MYPRIFIKQSSGSTFELTSDVNEKEIIEKVNEKINENPLTIGTIQDAELITHYDEESKET